LRRLRATPRRFLVIAVVGVLTGAIAVTWLVSLSRGSGRSGVDRLEARMRRIEERLGLPPEDEIVARAEGGRTAAPPAAVVGSGATPKTPAAADDPKKAACAVAKVAAYGAWQEALAKAKTLAAPAEAECADMWSERKKQACYYTASQHARTAQAARDAVMKGGIPAREAVKNAKDDPKNDLIPRARSASEAAFSACNDEDEF
jgi:hypothetical protein